MSGFLYIHEPDNEGWFSAKDGGRRYVGRFVGDFEGTAHKIMAAKPELTDWVFTRAPEASDNYGIGLGLHTCAIRELSAAEIGTSHER